MRRTIIFSSILLMSALAASTHAQQAGVFDPATSVFLLRNSAPLTTSVFAGKTVRLRIAATNNRSKDVNDMYIFQSPVLLSERQVSCDSSRPVSGSSAGLTAGKVTWSYNKAAKEYQYDLQTDNAWKSTCRIVAVRLKDGAAFSALLRFK
jgi:hypothetical protein